MIDLNALRKSKGHVLAMVNTKTGEYELVHSDVIEVIRCKDCKYFERRSIYHHGLCDVHCDGIGDREVTSEEAFCSWAERKEE